MEHAALAAFRTGAFGRQPFAQPNAAESIKPLFTWETLDRILANPSQPDALVVRNGAAIEEPSPRSLTDVRNMFTEGKSVVIRKGERHDIGLRNLADEFAREFQGKSTIQLFVTPNGTHSFGWHYDVEDVFIVQTAGVKEYFLRQNTVNPKPTLQNMPRDLGYERETSPLASCTLLAGDWLYLPSGWWHVARCVEDSLSISIGVLSARAEGLV
jgi:ribosomal protein L16 Arg81 hydroxylase